MTVREYIGARYVPLFMGDWDNTNAYEPLSIVQYQGNSYTSRQAVPVGIDITNTAYWAVTGNYNAQVEAYRQEVRNLAGIIPDTEFTSTNTVKDYIDGKDVSDLLPATDFSSANTVKDYIDGKDVSDLLPATDFSSANTVKDYIDTGINKSSGISYVGNYGAIEKDDSVIWQDVIDAIAEVSDTIDFGNGQWYVSNEIVIPQNIRRVTGHGCIITITSVINSFINFHDYMWIGSKRFFTFDGLTFDGDGKCNHFIYADDSTTGHKSLINLINCSFRNWLDTAVKCVWLGTFAVGCFFINQDQNLRNKGVAIHSTSDTFICNCKSFSLGTHYIVGSGSHIDSCYMFSSQYQNPSTDAPTIGIKGSGIDVTDGVIITGCEFDCLTYSVQNLRRGIIIKNNYFYWNGVDDTKNAPHAIFTFDNSMTYNALGPCNFDDNFISMSISTPIANSVHTVLDVNGNKNVHANGYSSKGNVFVMNDAINSHFKVFCGVRGNHSSALSNTVCTKLVPYDSTDTQSQNENHVLQPDNVHCQRNGATSSLSNLKSVHTQTRTVYKKTTANQEWYVTGTPMQFEKVESYAGSMYDMEWQTYEIANLDLSGFTQVNLSSAIS